MSSLTKSFYAGFISTFLILGVSTASADQLSGKLDTALDNKNLSAVQGFLATGPGNVDQILKALLRKTQTTMSQDPAYSNKMMSLAGQYAPQITPQSVPAICADLRRIADALTPEQTGTPLYKSVMDATETFSKAPVVVAAGRPNECEQAWLQLSNDAEEALLAQTPGMRGPSLPPTTVQHGPGVPPGVPPTTPPPTSKPSAD